MRRPILGVVLASVAALAACSDLKRIAYEGFGGRDDWQQPERVVAALELEHGDRVVDLGAGAGYFTGRLAEAVGSSGEVLAVDVDEALLESLADRVEAAGHANVRTIVAAPDDPRIPAKVDLVFTCNTYHHIEDRIAYFRSLAGSLESHGRVAVIELAGRGWGFAAWFGHSTSAEVIRDEMAAAGYSLERELDFLDRQHFLVFSRAE